MNRAFLLVIAAIFFSAPCFAFDVSGLQPVAPNSVFSTFSAESIPKNKFSIETAFEKSKDPDFYRFSLRGGYGISDSIEFDINIPYVYNFNTTVDGMEDIAVGFKHRFYDEGKYGPSLAYVINASINNGREEFSTHGRYGIGFIISKRVGPFKGHLNFFYERPGLGRLADEITFLGGIELSAAHNFKMLAEILTRKSHFSNEYDQTEVRFGYRIKTTDSIYTTIGIGTDLNKRSPEYRILISLSYTSPEKKKEIRKIIEEE